MRNGKFFAMVGCLCGGILLTLYPVVIAPYRNPDPWKEIQQVTRKDIVQEDIQPGGMKVWTDPFGRKKS